jgi:hypothetical protein
MHGIKLTEEDKAKMFVLIEHFYEASEYGSYDNLKKETNTSLSLVLSDDNHFILSHTVLQSPQYSDLMTFLKLGMGSVFEPVEVAVKKAAKVEDLNGQF